MRRRLFLISALTVPVLTQTLAAQESGRVPRIGWLTAQRPASLAPYVEAFRVALAEHGYLEGRNLVIEFRYGEDALERVPKLASELVRLPVDLIVAQGAALFEISQLGLPVPIVYAISADPISAGFADSLARPRGNMTGLTFMAVEFNGKRLELLRDIVPRLRRVAVIGNPEHPGAHLERAFSEQTGRQLGLTMAYMPTRNQEELSDAFATMAADPPQAISVLADGFAVQNRQAIMEFGAKHRLPVISGWPIFAQSGALCTYGPRLVDAYRRLAYYVNRILKGAKPAELPIEQPTTFELVINLKTAKALGLTIPQSVLARADQVIE
jgi:putative tryptophan/tyrosine transport system substrate-binding protein